ncbi:unnamed protein product [Blepharisma stoltei]|uniref:VPS9 domain-containing protein n=1 Tax=Blepharisma stoltei TaxID=1481888 RepID=A0AAU9JY07_9CILI|nr:unnamed protein product [Blepharisma stoltei]
MIDYKSKIEDSEIRMSSPDEEKKRIYAKDSLDLTGDYSPRGSISFRTDILCPDSPGCLPYIKIELPLQQSHASILNLLTKISSKKGFEVTERSPSAITAIHTPNNRFQKFLCCWWFKESSNEETSIVRILICMDERRNKRILVAKGMSGEEKPVSRLLNSIEKSIDKFLRTPQKQNETYNKIEFDEEEESTMTCKNESSSYCLFHKILSSESYTLGKSLSQFIDSFKSQYRNPNESALLLPQPIESIKLQVEETVDSLFSHYNYGRSSTEKIMIYCRPSVEKYIYSKLMPHLLDIYNVKTEEFESKLQNTRRECEGVSDSSIMERLDIPTKLRMEDEKEPYSEAILLLNKLHHFGTPIEKLNCLLSIIESMKTEVVDYWKGEVEMEYTDEIKVLKFLAIKSDSIDLMGQIHMLIDYVGTRFDNEKRILLNFEEALRF